MDDFVVPWTQVIDKATFVVHWLNFKLAASRDQETPLQHCGRACLRSYQYGGWLAGRLAPGDNTLGRRARLQGPFTFRGSRGSSKGASWRLVL